MNISVGAEADLFKALSDKTRLRIVTLLIGRELCVCNLTQVLALPQPTVSRHMNILRTSGVVIDRRAGRWVHYRLEDLSPLSALQDFFVSLRKTEPYRSDFAKLTEFLKAEKC